MECTVFFEGEDGDLITSEPLEVRITLFTKLKGVLFWLILFPCLLLKENRSLKILWAFLPCAVWIGISFGIELLTGLPGEILIPVPMIMCGLLLCGARFQSWSGRQSLLVTVLVAALFHGIWMWAGNAESLPFSAIVSGILFLVVLISLILVRLACRGKYSAVKFSIILLPVVMALTVGSVLVIGLLFVLAQGELQSVLEGGFLLAMILALAVEGLIVYGMILSFLLVPFLSEFHRERLCGLLKLRRNSFPASEPPPLPSVLS